MQFDKGVVKVNSFEELDKVEYDTCINRLGFRHTELKIDSREFGYPPHLDGVVYTLSKEEINGPEYLVLNTYCSGKPRALTPFMKKCFLIGCIEDDGFFLLNKFKEMSK